MKTIDHFNFSGKRAIIRVDYNVPLNENFVVTDTTRIDATLPTIHKILKEGGSVILMSHLGRPKNGPENKYSLKHIIPVLSAKLEKEIKFADDCMGQDAVDLAASLKPGEVLLLENLRFYKEEEKGNEEFAGKLATYADYYVNDAFGTAHRAHASTTIIARFFPGKKMFGYVMAGELASIKKVLDERKKPFTAILGGAKVSGKIEIIRNLLDKADNIIIGGGMMFTFYKAMGYPVGNSLIEDDLLEVAKTAMEDAKSKGVNLYLPVDTVLADAFDNNAHKKEAQVDAIPDGWMGLDIGGKTCKTFAEIIENSSTILWNGPMGVFEMSNFEHGTKAIAESVARATQKGAFSLIGGGDSVAAINKYGLAKEVSYVSTGGGAMLEFIEGKTLPGVQAIDE